MINIVLKFMKKQFIEIKRRHTNEEMISDNIRNKKHRKGFEKMNKKIKKAESLMAVYMQVVLKKKV